MKKKLYFDFQFTMGLRSRYFPCTWQLQGNHGTANRVVDERYGDFLVPLAALTGGAPAATKERNEVSAWFNIATVITGVGATFALDFVGGDLTTPVAFLAPGGAVLTAKAGLSAVFTSRFGVRLRLMGITNTGIIVNNPTGHILSKPAIYEGVTDGKVDIKGTCYVQRQHSVEV